MRETLHQCPVCGKNFKARRSDAKTCSSPCRQKLCAARKGRDVKSSVALGDVSFNNLMIIRTHKPNVAQMIDTIIVQHGAIAAEWAIAACMGMVS